MNLKSIIQFTVLIVLFTIVSCENANKDFSKIIETNFKLSRNSENEVELSKFKEVTKSEIKVKGHILFYGHNSEFIILNQKETDSVKGFEKLNINKKMLEVYKSNYSEYYILEIEKDSVFGPYNKTKYLEMRKKLKIAENLKLDNSTMEFFTMIQRNDINYFKDLDQELLNIEKLKGNNFSSIFD